MVQSLWFDTYTLWTSLISCIEHYTPALWMQLLLLITMNKFLFIFCTFGEVKNMFFKSFLKMLSYIFHSKWYILGSGGLVVRFNEGRGGSWFCHNSLTIALSQYVSNNQTYHISLIVNMNAYKLIHCFYWIHFSDSLVTCMIHLISFLSISDMEQIAPPPSFLLCIYG